MSPGPWCEKPLWSLRHAVDVRRMLRLGTFARQSSLLASCSHLLCCTVIDALTIANASYVAKSPWRPVSV